MREFRAQKPAHRAYMQEYLKRYRAENPEKMAEYARRRLSDPAKRKRDAANRRRCAYRQKYGITIEQVNVMLEAQGNACAICGNHLARDAINVDHCHESGRVRGLLCSGCNTGLGLLGDNEEGLMKALNYLAGSAKK